MEHYAVIGVSPTNEYGKRLSDLEQARQLATEAIKDERLTDVYIFHVDGLSAETAGRSDLSMTPIGWYTRQDGQPVMDFPDNSGPDTLAKAQAGADRLLDQFIAK